MIVYLRLLRMKSNQVKIEESWKKALDAEFNAPYFEKLSQFIKSELQNGKTIYPPGSLTFNAFNTTPFDDVKVVIIGQDPYHGPGQAMGLSFSVPDDMPIPASLKNIYKELHRDLGMEIPESGNLTNWAKQGVFLLNAMLTVEKNKAGSHKKIGWQIFTDAVIHTLSKEKEGLIFLLWGNFAKAKKALIDPARHYILESVHPSPLAGGGFIGNGHFSKANEILINLGKQPIDWRI